MGHRQGRNDEEYATAILQTFLDKAFRRPATGEQVSNYVNVALRHTSEGNRFEDGIHLAIKGGLVFAKVHLSRTAGSNGSVTMTWRAD